MSLIRFLQPRIGSLLETAATSRSKILIPDFHDLSDPDQFKTYIPEQGSSKQRIETIRSEWQAACEEWTSLNVSEVLDEELIVGYAEGAVRQLVLETAYEEPLYDADGSTKYRFYCKMYDALEIGLQVFQVAYEQYQSPLMDPGGSLSAMLEELADVLTIESWNVVFGWVERRGETITADMQPSKGKSLTLLKLLNHLLNQTSHIMVNFEDSTNILLFRARIHLFITEWFKLNDMSGVNLRGEYSEMRSAWPNIEEDEEEEHEEDQEKEDLGSDTKETTEKQSKPADDGKQIENVETTENEQKETSGEEPTQEADVQATPDKMQVDLPEEKPAAEPEKPEEPKGEDLYTSLYHVQTVFVHPPSLVVAPSKTPAQEGESSETPIQAFRRRSDLILAELKYRRNEALAMIKEIKEAILAGEDDAELRSEEYPVFLTSRSTLKADLVNPAFLKRVYAQFYIMFNQLVQLTAKERPKHPKNPQFPPTFVVSDEDAEWARGKMVEITLEFEKKIPDGRDFIARVKKMIEMDRHYAIWKHLGCKPIELPPTDESTITKAEQNRQSMIAPLRKYRWPAGTKSLSRLGTDPLRSVEQLEQFKIQETVQGLKEKYDREVMEEEDEKAMGREFTTRLGPFVENKASLSWKALRLASQTDLSVFPKAKKGDLHDLIAAIEAKRAEEAGGTSNVEETMGQDNAEDNEAEDVAEPEQEVETVAEDEDTPPTEGEADVEVLTSADTKEEATSTVEVKEEDAVVPMQEDEVPGSEVVGSDTPPKEEVNADEKPAEPAVPEQTETDVEMS